MAELLNLLFYPLSNGIMTVLTGMSLLYWVFMFFSGDGFDTDAEFHMGDVSDGDVNTDADGEMSFGSKVLEFINIGKMPLMVIVTLFKFIGWILTLLSSIFLGLASWGIKSVLILLPVFAITFVIMHYLTKPLVKMYKNLGYNGEESIDFLGSTHTINRNDRNALTAIALEAKENLAIETFRILVDKGYHNGRELTQCKEENITTIVAHPEQGTSNENGTTKAYLVANFIYNAASDTYTCPANQTLKTTGRWHKKTRERDSYEFKKYRTPACKECPVKSFCTSRTGGREIDRSQYADAVEENNQRYQENQQLYRKRQEINEHIFGTIKRQWGYNHTNLTGLEKVNGEHSLIMLVYNIKRAITILGVPDLIAKLKNWKSPYKTKVLLYLKLTYLGLFRSSFINQFVLAS